MMSSAFVETPNPAQYFGISKDTGDFGDWRLWGRFWLLARNPEGEIYPCDQGEDGIRFRGNVFVVLFILPADENPTCAAPDSVAPLFVSCSSTFVIDRCTSHGKHKTHGNITEYVMPRKYLVGFFLKIPEKKNQLNTFVASQTKNITE